MAKRDYYEVLGISRSASADDVRKAYRTLARKHHPDVSKAADAHSRFAEISEAYEVLSDPQKRQQYDYLGHAGVGAPGGAGPGQGQRVRWSTGGAPGGVEDFFSGAGGGQGIDLEELFGSFTGRGGGRPRPRRGQDIEYQLTLDFLQAVKGVTTSIQVQRPTGGGAFAPERIEVKIPPGVDDGSRVRVRSKGSPGQAGGPSGDLYIVVRVQEHPYFRRKGRDVYIDLPVTVVEAGLGAKVDIPTLEGRTSLTIPPCTSSGTRLRLKGQGVPNPKTQTAGDLYAVVKIVMPSRFSDEGRELIERLARTDPHDPRKGLW